MEVAVVPVHSQIVKAAHIRHRLGIPGIGKAVEIPILMLFYHILAQHQTEGIKKGQPLLFSGELDMAAYLADKDAVLVPKNYEKYCSEEDAGKLQDFAKHGKLILCAYEMDEGSVMHLEEKLQQLRREKTM